MHLKNLTPISITKIIVAALPLLIAGCQDGELVVSLEEAKKITPESGITKHDGQEPGVKPYASSIVASLVAAKADHGQVAAALTIMNDKNKRKFSMGTLRKMHEAELAKGQGGSTASDVGLLIAEATLKRHFADGDHLIRAMDKCFWAYTSTHWQRITGPWLSR